MSHAFICQIRAIADLLTTGDEANLDQLCAVRQAMIEGQHKLERAIVQRSTTHPHECEARA